MKRRHFILCLPTLCVIIVLVVLVVEYTAATKTLRRVIVDVDPGIDDLEAIVFLINADKQQLLKIEAIVVTEGNTHYAYGIRNVFLLLLVVNRTDIPVYVGAKGPILDHDDVMGGFYGSDGIGDLTWKTKVPIDLSKKECAYKTIHDLVEKHPQQISYMTLGPMTTLGIAIRLYPEVAEKLKDVYSMGGLIYNGEGEFNVKFDPESVDIVLRSMKSKMVLITWQAGATNSPLTNWYKNVTVENNPAWNLMTRIQDAINKMLFGDDLSNAKWEHCDPIVPAVYLKKEISLMIFRSRLHIQVGRGRNRGIITNSTSSKDAVDVVLEIDYDLMLKDYVDAFKSVCDAQGSVPKCHAVD